MPKVEILRNTIDYIESLEELLNNGGRATGTGGVLITSTASVSSSVDGVTSNCVGSEVGKASTAPIGTTAGYAVSRTLMYIMIVVIVELFLRSSAMKLSL
jgi:hypothetical protein